MTDEELERFYEVEYRNVYSNIQQPSADLLNIQQQRGNHLAHFLAEYAGFAANDSFTYLDIGCSTGVHLDAVQKLFPNAHLYGIEPGKAFREFCIDKGLKVFKDIDEMQSAGIKADVICMSHVLEHIPEPANYLKHVSNTIAASNGLLLIEVPNTLGGHLSFEIAHPICFYDQSLINTCHVAGFEKIAIKTHNVTSKYPEPQYLTGLFKKSNTHIAPIDYSYLNAASVIKRRNSIVIRDNSKSVAFRLKRKVLRFFREF